MHLESTIVWADSAYAGKLVTWAKRHLNLTIKPVSRPKHAFGFVVLPGTGSSRGLWPGRCTPAGMLGTTNGSFSTPSP
jgi:hypothetical protein